MKKKRKPQKLDRMPLLNLDLSLSEVKLIQFKKKFIQSEKKLDEIFADIKKKFPRR